MSKVESFAELLAWQPPFLGTPIISEGILLPETRMIVAGEAGSWKSFLALHTMGVLSRGLPWFGYRTRKVTVLKVQAELPKYQDKERAQLYGRSAHIDPCKDGCMFFKTVGDTAGAAERVKLDTTWGMNALAGFIEEAKSRSPNLQLVVILDPLKDLFSGHITDEYDVLKFQDNINVLMRKYSFAIIIFHHNRKRQLDETGAIVDRGGEEGLGSIHWKNWCDTWLSTMITNPYTGKDIIEYKWEKHRNAHDYLRNFTVQWNRATLVPEILSVGSTELMRVPTTRGLVDYE